MPTTPAAPFSPDQPVSPDSSSASSPPAVCYKIINPAYDRHARSLRYKNAATIAVYLLLFWGSIVLLLRPEPFWEGLIAGLERSGPLLGGVLICVLWLYLRPEQIPSAWKNVEQTLTFDDTGLIFASDLQHTYMGWRAFQSWEESAHGFTLEGWSPVFIPSPPFSPEALAAFRECLRTNLPGKNLRTDNH